MQFSPPQCPCVYLAKPTAKELLLGRVIVPLVVAQSASALSTSGSAAKKISLAETSFFFSVSYWQTRADALQPPAVGQLELTCTWRAAVGRDYA